MPLVKSASKKAFEKNVSTEAKSKPINQAVAIAYNVQRTSAQKAGKPSKAPPKAKK